MSKPPRRSRRLAPAAAAAPSPDTPPPARLLDLPTELLVRVVSRCDPVDIARVAAVSLLFHASLAEQGIRLWAQERGFGDGAVWSWGYGSYGQLGHGDLQTQLLPKQVEAFAGQRVVAVSAGGAHSLAITADGAVWSWGYGYNGRLGHGDGQAQLLPKKVEAFAGQHVVAVSAGRLHSIALTADGAVWSWGGGYSGQQGHGDRQPQLEPKKVEALAGERVVAVSAGAEHNLALTADGAVWSWGRGCLGQLGHGDRQQQLLPKKVEGLEGRRVVAVSAGDGHSIAITADGAVWSWGYGGHGLLGHGDEQRQLLPKKIEAFAGRRVNAVSAGLYHSFALTDDGAVCTWGKGECGC